MARHVATGSKVGSIRILSVKLALRWVDNQTSFKLATVILRLRFLVRFWKKTQNNRGTTVLGGWEGLACRSSRPKCAERRSWHPFSADSSFGRELPWLFLVFGLTCRIFQTLTRSSSTSLSPTKFGEPLPAQWVTLAMIFVWWQHSRNQVLLAGITQTVLPDGSALNSAQATQIGLVWRLARRASAYRSGLSETEFQDVDPWQEPAAQDPGRQSSSSAGIKEKILKMSALIDQSDDSELVPPTSVEINGWLQNHHAIMGAMPEESEEPSPNQLAALAKRVFRDDAPPYVDFGVFGPFERKLTKAQRCRIYTPLGDGTFLQRDFPGPPTYQGWLAAWRVLKTACLMLNIASLAALEVYGRHIEKLVTQWPSAWGLIYQAEDAARAERMAKLRRQFTVESGMGRQVPADWNPQSPWSCIFVQLAKDDSYWSEKVHIRAAAWVAAGARGQPVVASEAADFKIRTETTLHLGMRAQMADEDKRIETKGQLGKESTSPTWTSWDLSDKDMDPAKAIDPVEAKIQEEKGKRKAKISQEHPYASRGLRAQESVESFQQEQNVQVRSNVHTNAGSACRRHTRTLLATNRPGVQNNWALSVAVCWFEKGYFFGESFVKILEKKFQSGHIPFVCDRLRWYFCCVTAAWWSRQGMVLWVPPRWIMAMVTKRYRRPPRDHLPKPLAMTRPHSVEPEKEPQVGTMRPRRVEVALKNSRNFEDYQAIQVPPHVLRS